MMHKRYVAPIRSKYLLSDGFLACTHRYRNDLQREGSLTLSLIA